MALDVDEKTSLITSFSLLENKEQCVRLILAVVIVSVASVCVGFSIGFTSSYNDEDSNYKEEMWFTALLGIGAIVGLIFAGSFIEHYGRKQGLVLAAILYIAGWILICYFPNGIETIFVGRILTGVATGFCSLTVSIYIAEVSPFQFRGRLGVINQVGFTIGICYASLVDFLDNQMVSAIAGLVISFFMGFLVLFIPESPRWLLTKKKKSEALKSLLWFRGTLYNVEDECSEIENKLELQNVAAQNDFIKLDFYRPFLYSSLLEVFRQMCGIYPLLFFGHGLVKMAGLTDPFFVVLYLTHVLFTVTMYFIVDKYKRRKLLMIGAFGMCICNILLGVYFLFYIESENDQKALRYDLFIKDDEKLEPFKVKYNQNYSYLAFGCFLFFILFYSIGWGTLPTLIMSEIFPPRLRGLSCSFVLGVSWCFSFFVTISFFKLVISFGIQVALWTFSVFCLISIFFVYYFVPETKDKTLEEIEHYFLMVKQWLNHLF